MIVASCPILKPAILSVVTGALHFVADRPKLFARLLASARPIYLSTSNVDQNNQILKRLKFEIPANLHLFQT
jgi:hypothetical protein